MSIYSVEDISREFGKNIYIYPTDNIIIKGASVDLSASKYAWSLNSKKSIYNEAENAIIIPPHDTAIIFTNEVLYVTNKIAGTYHAKVSFTAAGLSHIGTTLDPEFIGLSKVAIHNYSEKQYVLKENHTVVTVMFSRLRTPVAERSQPDCGDAIFSMQEFERYEEFRNFIDNRPWMINGRQLKKMVQTDESFQKYKKKLVVDNIRVRDLKTLFKKNGASILVGIVLMILFFAIRHYMTNAINDYVVGVILVILPLVLSKKTE